MNNLPELPLTPTGETQTMWTIVLICDECAGVDESFPEVRADNADEAGNLTRHEAQIRGWKTIHTRVLPAGSIDICPACVESFREMQEKAGIDL